ncbi:hypothetical protein ACFLUP_01270 [Chloroflexota bacterium]
MKRILITDMVIAISLAMASIPAGAASGEDKVTASDGATGDGFGFDVSVFGDTMVVGARYENNDTGAAYVYVHGESGWVEQTKLTASDGEPGDGFGYAVSVSANNIVVGAYGDDDYFGAAYVFTRYENVWSEQAKLTDADGSPGDFFGISVAINKHTLVVGAHADDEGNYNTGSACVFRYHRDAWVQDAKLVASDADYKDQFGYSVVVDNDTVVVGANAEKGDNGITGSVYIYVRDKNEWNEQAKLHADSTSWNFGVSVSISKDTLVVGSMFDTEIGYRAGSAFVYVRDGNEWTKDAKLFASDGTANDYFSRDVSIDKKTIIIGASGDDDNGSNSGSVYIFVRDKTGWSEQAKLIAGDGEANDNYGRAVANSNNTIAAGAYGDDDNGYNAGAVYTY